MEHWAKKKEDNEETDLDQFERLQDDVVLHILDKVGDIKWLCRCFIVSKRFSSLAPRVQTLSLNATLWDSLLKSCPDNDSHDEPRNFLGKFSKLLAKDDCILKPLRLVRIPSDSFPFSRLNFLNLVFCSQQVRSLNLELFSDFNDHDDSVFKWGAKFTAQAQLDSVTFLYAKSLSRMMESEEASENEISAIELLHQGLLAQTCAKYAVLWLATLSRVLENYPKLDCVTITDWKNKGVKLCLGGEKLAECRNTLVARSMLSPGAPTGGWKGQCCARVGYVPLLQLPNSGYVMKGVTIVHFKLSVNDYEADTGMVDAMLNAFAEEQGPFMEALRQIMEKHKDSIKEIRKVRRDKRIDHAAPW